MQMHAGRNRFRPKRGLELPARPDRLLDDVEPGGGILGGARPLHGPEDPLGIGVAAELVIGVAADDHQVVLEGKDKACGILTVHRDLSFQSIVEIFAAYVRAPLGLSAGLGGSRVYVDSVVDSKPAAAFEGWDLVCSWRVKVCCVYGIEAGFDPVKALGRAL